MKALLNLILLLSTALCCRAQNDKNCYYELLNNNKPLSAQIDSSAIFKCGAGTLKEFFERALSFDDIPEFDTIYKDTLKALFIIDKEGRMSNLKVNANKSALLERRIKRLLISSACSWIPGRFNDAVVNGCYELYVYCTFNKQTDFGWISIDYIISNHSKTN